MIELACKGRADPCKCFLLGHSMCGLIALYYAQRFPDTIDGVLASSPALGMAIEVPAGKKILGAVMSFRIPILTQIAGDDHLVNARTAVQFFEKLELRDKTLLVYDGLYLEIYNEPAAQRVQVLKDLEG